MQELFDIPGGGGFQFSGEGIDDLGAMEYSLCTLVRDLTSSLGGFETLLQMCTKETVRAMQNSPRSENMMVRLVDFHSGIGVREVHGFKLLKSIDVDNDYGVPATQGWTNLYDAAYAAIAATVNYSKALIDQDFLCNGIVVVMTDGEDNASRNATPKAIAELLEQTRRRERDIESLLTVLVGFNLKDPAIKQCLERFKTEASFDQFVDAKDVTKATMVKLAGFISSTFSSVSSQLGSGTSQPIDPNF